MNIVEQRLIEETLTKLLQEGKINCAENFSVECLGGLKGRFKINFEVANDDAVRDKIANGDFDDDVIDRADDLNLYDMDDIVDKIIYEGEFDEEVEKRAETLGYIKEGGKK